MITLAEPWTAAAQGRINRALLAALAHPGEVVDLGAAGGGRAALAALATLADAAVALCDLHRLLDPAERSLLGAGEAGAAEAPFVLADGARAPDAGLRLNAGTQLRPESGATLVLECAEVGAGALALQLSGPGNAAARGLRLDGLDPAWLALREEHAGFPCGLDLVLADRRRVACIPRTTCIRRND
ncbi:MAG: phosphonate C-P lyase system protein PhnH [Planctomycetes bacterium]|nr:phosphonate C-P lyase system protein PhnH [Planctomycetota bacterium]